MALPLNEKDANKNVINARYRNESVLRVKKKSEELFDLGQVAREFQERLIRGSDLRTEVIENRGRIVVTEQKNLTTNSEKNLPPYIHIKPGRGGFSYKDAGFLGAKFGALALGDGKPPANLLRNQSITAEIDEARNRLRKSANQRFGKRRRTAESEAYDFSYKMASQFMENKHLLDSSTFSPRDVERYYRIRPGRFILPWRNSRFGYS